MKALVLNPEQIIVPRELELGNPRILEIYHRIFAMGKGGILPPVIVVHQKNIGSEKRKEIFEERIKMVKERFCDTPHERDENASMWEAAYAEFNKLLGTAPYYLLDGNHRSTACVLTHTPISALELQCDADLSEIKAKVERGDLFRFEREESSIQDLTWSFEDHCIRYQGIRPRSVSETLTVKERVEKLAEKEDLPRYIIKRYLQGKK